MEIVPQVPIKNTWEGLQKSLHELECQHHKLVDELLRNAIGREIPELCTHS